MRTSRVLLAAATMFALGAFWQMDSRPQRHRGSGRRATDTALESIREEERAYIARELHDDLGQLLAALRLDLHLMQQKPSPELLVSMDELLMSAITSLRRIAADLRPRALDEGGLYFALQSLRSDFEHRNGIPCHLLACEDQLELDDRYSTAVYRLVQESLTNIARHARASQVSLRLARTNGELRIAILDDGRGIGPGDLDKPASFGLLGMRERVAALHGTIEIGEGMTGEGGTQVAIRLPLPAGQ